ncbi:hypothetical protein OEA41_006639 [Lepraria neglecta]|uniref:Sulfhydryl oxidase n=1 Tax=Lepraria neglecta TaxID=209136 RepID=A0AAD9Z8E6_9LECA|nr:hypothetical protein OEA41_006639 [Lepraria neglecta]
MDKFFTDVQKEHSKPSTQSGEGKSADGTPKKAVPKGVVLGKDGKPCRSCTSFASWAAMTKKNTSEFPQTTTVHPQSTAPPDDCPPDVEALGRSTWTFLHTLSASYPPHASPTQQSEMRQFLDLFSRLYPCWTCAEDFQEWMRSPGNEPRVSSRGEFGRWMCEAHNEVNRKLGKEVFECSRWEERWRTGWKDGRCD